MKREQRRPESANSIEGREFEGRSGEATPDVEVRLERLTKRFSAGVAAVTDLSLTIRRGEVFALLGPNGSGKTTTLRMLVGLIRPTAGTAFIGGERVVPGHHVLRRVGVLIEAPAFVPYLTGRRNLELFWRAGGESLECAHFGEAVAVAGLGTAIDRDVNTYSKGMRQRLGIAQALLNAPNLLILDEPSVGLDPEETRDVRTLIRGFADRGATVLLATHNLTEVEQVCSHAAVIDRGRLVACGAVSDIMGATSAVYVEVTDPRGAADILRDLAGVSDVSPEGGGLTVRLDGIAREDVVNALVRAGVGVGTITSRRRLEDAFVELMSERAE